MLWGGAGLYLLWMGSSLGVMSRGLLSHCGWWLLSSCFGGLLCSCHRVLGPPLEFSNASSHVFHVGGLHGEGVFSTFSVRGSSLIMVG